ncbi:MAG: DUF72 domain-containing protein [Candidatus Omnitrophica bacterium]|nr:DUF72 domain-containing protein [Candidatus Omnitrophota bacterium]MBD3269360.1 DUF72 domain-containing protein [Candidatus Omnitrophota bacterium]
MHWKGNFYPQDLAAKNFLSFYCDKFETAEINNSFYRLPKKEMLKNWVDATPEDFLFSVKASRYITHMKKLKEPKKSIKAFFDTIGVLGKKMGPVLFQLPPRWKVNPRRLTEFLNELPEGFRYAFEFRDVSWFDDEIYKILRKAGASFCLYELAGESAPLNITADFVYIRLHGPAGAYEGSYSKTALEEWKNKIVKWSREAKEIYCYFDNDQQGFAAANALSLKEIIDKEARGAGS